MARGRLLSNPASGCCGAELPVPDWDARLPLHGICSITSEPGGSERRNSPSGRVRKKTGEFITDLDVSIVGAAPNILVTTFSAFIRCTVCRVFVVS